MKIILAVILSLLAVGAVADWSWAVNDRELYNMFPREDNWASPVQNFEIKKNIAVGSLTYNYSKIEIWQCLGISAFSTSTQQSLNFLQSTGVHDMALDNINTVGFNLSTCGNASTHKIASWTSTPSAGTAAILTALSTGPALIRMKVSNYVALWTTGIQTNCTSSLNWVTFNVVDYDSTAGVWKVLGGGSEWGANGYAYLSNSGSCGTSMNNATLYTLTY